MTPQSNFDIQGAFSRSVLGLNLDPLIQTQNSYNQGMYDYAVVVTYFAGVEICDVTIRASDDAVRVSGAIIGVSDASIRNSNATIRASDATIKDFDVAATLM